MSRTGVLVFFLEWTAEDIRGEEKERRGREGGRLNNDVYVSQGRA